MANTVVINDQDVHVGWIVMNTLWAVLALSFLPFLYVQLYRVYMILKSSKSPAAFHGLAMQWTHIAVIWLCYLIAGADASRVYFDEAKLLVNILLSEVNVLFANLFIFYFCCHVEAYIVSNKDLSMPTWLVRARLVAMIANFVGGNICLGVAFGMRRPHLSLLPQLWSGLIAVQTAFALGSLAFFLARKVRRQRECRRETDEMNTVGRALRKFKWTSLMSALLGFAIGAILIPFSLIPMVTTDKNLRFEDVDWMNSERSAAAEFSFRYVSWLSYTLLFWAFKVFWIPKALFEREVHGQTEAVRGVHPHSLKLQNSSYTTRSLLELD